jgi:hypothetical protein
LGMKAPVRWVFILLLADRAHFERCHRCFVTVIRNIFDDRKSWTTQGTVDKGITIPKVFRRKKFRKTFITGGHVRRDEDEFLLSVFTLPDFKSDVTYRIKVFHSEGFNSGQGRGMGRDILNELMKTSIFAFGIDKHSFSIVEDPSSNRMGFGQIVDKGPETDSLNDSSDVDLHPFHVNTLTLF